MSLFFILFISLATFIILTLIVHGVYLHRHMKRLIVLSMKIESGHGRQKVLLSSLLNKLEKMEIYRDALDNVEIKEVRSLFEELINDEDRHLDSLKKALAE